LARLLDEVKTSLPKEMYGFKVGKAFGSDASASHSKTLKFVRALS